METISRELSCGGYDKLKETIVKGKRKQRDQELVDHSLILNCSPSPSSHHEK